MKVDPHGVIASTRYQDDEARRLTLVASVGYGLVYTVAFSLTVWGRDTAVLTRIHAELAWGKLGLGLPLLLLVGAGAGYLAGRRHSAGLSIGIWAVAGGLIGLTVGWIPYGGYDWLTWLSEPRLRGFAAYPMAPAGTTRMWFIAIITGTVGAAAGLVGHLLVEKSWDLASSRGRLSVRSWAVLLLCVPLAVLPGVASDETVNADLRERQNVAHEAIVLTLEGRVSRPELEPYLDRMTEHFTLHLADYDLVANDAQVDAAFDTDFVARCLVLGQSTAGCVPISERFDIWMDAMIQDALTGDQPNRLLEHADRLLFDQRSVEELAAERGRMSEEYVLTRATQHGRWVIMSARFDTRQELDCYFRGAQPVVLELCRFR